MTTIKAEYSVGGIGQLEEHKNDFYGRVGASWFAITILYAAITGVMGLFSGSGSWATDGLIETVFSNLATLSYSSVWC